MNYLIPLTSSMIRGSSSTDINGTLFIMKLMQPLPPKYALRISRFSVSEPGQSEKKKIKLIILRGRNH